MVKQLHREAYLEALDTAIFPQTTRLDEQRLYFHTTNKSRTLFAVNSSHCR